VPGSLVSRNQWRRNIPLLKGGGCRPESPSSVVMHPTPLRHRHTPVQGSTLEQRLCRPRRSRQICRHYAVVYPRPNPPVTQIFFWALVCVAETFNPGQTFTEAAHRDRGRVVSSCEQEEAAILIAPIENPVGFGFTCVGLPSPGRCD
jgi:hypothetical protein